MHPSSGCAGNQFAFTGSIGIGIRAVLDGQSTLVGNKSGGRALLGSSYYVMTIEVKNDILRGRGSYGASHNVDHVIADHRNRGFGAVRRDGGYCLCEGHINSTSNLGDWRILSFEDLGPEGFNSIGLKRSL